MHHDYEDLELWYPVLRMREEGFSVDLAGEQRGKEYHGKHGLVAVADLGFREAKTREYDFLLIPGGWAPDKLRRVPDVLQMVREANERNAIIGQICHAGWVTISAKIMKGRRVTGTSAIRDDMENAGAIWCDEPMVRDGNLISSRHPGDLPAYAKALVAAVRERG